jgi:two-component sensor histidine kinase
LSKATDRIARLPLMQAQPVARMAITIALCLAALAIRWELGRYFPPGYPFVTFFPTVIVSSFLFGKRAGIVAAVLCGLFAWYFFIPPIGRFAFDQASMVAMLFYTGVVAVDIVLIHWMQLANKRLREAREESRRLTEESDRLVARTDLLFQELQHRVGNNLQMVAAVLSMQLRNLEEPAARRAISDAVQRVQVIGSIQRRLYRSNGELVPLDDYVGEVCDQLMISSGRPGIACSVKAATGLVLPPDAAVPMALILAEALANAMEHGFVGRDAGRVDVVLEHEGEQMMLQVRDNGNGLPAQFDIGKADSLGLRISRVLSRQLGATYTLEDAGPGCRMRLTLPAARFAPHLA